MYKRILTAATILAMSLQVNAQATIATNFKPTGQANPLSGCVFCADPTALEYNGRLYVYGSNDHQQFIKNGKKGENGYGDIKSLVVFSTDDMVNWTFHGTIDVAKVCSREERTGIIYSYLTGEELRSIERFKASLPSLQLSCSSVFIVP